ncbi:hypothetical protein BDQ17DRAFT_1380164 [Cyathus striatus]|nr:hypothetical protein BDQ17DRAFT_1380164 [Cyathus striatus]
MKLTFYILTSLLFSITALSHPIYDSNGTGAVLVRSSSGGSTPEPNPCGLTSISATQRCDANACSAPITGNPRGFCSLSASNRCVMNNMRGSGSRIACHNCKCIKY